MLIHTDQRLDVRSQSSGSVTDIDHLRATRGGEQKGKTKSYARRLALGLSTRLMLIACYSRPFFPMFFSRARGRGAIAVADTNSTTRNSASNVSTVTAPHGLCPWWTTLSEFNVYL